MFENTIKNITAGRQEMFDSALKMYKEMCPNDNPNKCVQAHEAWFVMGNLQTMYQEFNNNICGLTLTALAENIKQYKKFEQQYDKYIKALSPYLHGDFDSRLEAFMKADYITIDNINLSLNLAAKNLNQIKENMANTREWIEKAEQSLAHKKYIMYQCHKQLKEIYDRFKIDQAAQQKTEEKKPEQKKIIIAIDTSHLDLRNPRFVQQAYDTLKSFLKHAEVTEIDEIKLCDDILKEFKKGVVKEAEKEFVKTVNEEGLIFKLSTAE